jgi:pyruvate/2-oxoglutarate dehydrogenase complex dihydrolipoamide acyltransferase (E2) component
LAWRRIPGLLVNWLKAPGDEVAADDVLFEVETDKSTMEVEAGRDGLARRDPGRRGRRGAGGRSVIAIISAAKPENAVARSHKSTPAQDDEASGAATDKAPPAAGERPRTGAVPVSGGRILASPKTRRLAREKGLDLNLLVENGVPQPYHVSDLGLLETLVPSTKAAGASASRAAAGALPMHIGARVAASGCDEFIAWLARSGFVTDFAGRMEQPLRHLL